MRSESVLLINDDLFFTARLASVLRAVGFNPRVCSSEEAALREAEASDAAVAIVNVACRQFEALPVVRKLKRLPNPPVVLAFYSHALISAIKDEAMAVGIDRLVANSAIVARLPALLAELLNRADMEV